MRQVNGKKKEVGKCIRALRHNIKFMSLIITSHRKKFQPTVYVAILNIM
jgi:hypothetical protein